MAVVGPEQAIHRSDLQRGRAQVRRRVGQLNDLAGGIDNDAGDRRYPALASPRATRTSRATSLPDSPCPPPVLPPTANPYTPALIRNCTCLRKTASYISPLRIKGLAHGADQRNHRRAIQKPPAIPLCKAGTMGLPVNIS